MTRERNRSYLFGQGRFLFMGMIFFVCRLLVFCLGVIGFLVGVFLFDLMVRGVERKIHETQERLLGKTIASPSEQAMEFQRCAFGTMSAYC